MNYRTECLIAGIVLSIFLTTIGIGIGYFYANYGGCLIVWRDYKYDFKYKHPDFSSKQWMGGMDSYFCRNELEVVGNQYENFNLLTK